MKFRFVQYLRNRDKSQLRSLALRDRGKNKKTVREQKLDNASNLLIKKFDLNTMAELEIRGVAAIQKRRRL